MLDCNFVDAQRVIRLMNQVRRLERGPQDTKVVKLVATLKVETLLIVARMDEREQDDERRKKVNRIEHWLNQPRTVRG